MDIGRTYSLLWGRLSQWYCGRLENRMCAGLYQHAERYASLKDVCFATQVGLCIPYYSKLEAPLRSFPWNGKPMMLPEDARKVSQRSLSAFYKD